MKSSHRVGIVEIGSRAVRMLVADVQPRVDLRIIASDGHNCRLAAALRDTAEVRRETLTEIARVATEFVDRCRYAEAERICVFGTEALRRLAPADLDELRRTLPNLVLLRTEVEALCSLLAAGYALPEARHKGDLLVIDQGAGSMELAAGRFRKGKLVLISAVSHPLGAWPLLAQLRALEGNFAILGSTLLAQSSSWTLPKGIGKAAPLVQGSVATKLAWFSKRKSKTERYDPRVVQGVPITIAVMDALISKASSEPDLVRRTIDLHDSGSDDFDSFMASLIALRLMLGKLDATSFVTSSYGTRFGVAWHLAEPDPSLA